MHLEFIYMSTNITHISILDCLSRHFILISKRIRVNSGKTALKRVLSHMGMKYLILKLNPTEKYRHLDQIRWKRKTKTT